jgi:hypothetical protein
MNGVAHSATSVPTVLSITITFHKLFHESLYLIVVTICISPLDCDCDRQNNLRRTSPRF